MPPEMDDSLRHLRLNSPLGGDLLLSQFSGKEEMSRLFRFNLDMVSNNPDLKFGEIVGQRVTIELDLENSVRFFDGFVTDFHYLGFDEPFVRYQATVRPWLWFLSRTSDCRIFLQGQDGIRTVPDIIKSVFSDNGMDDVEFRLNGTYRDWVYCVQYRETDFNFVSRLMEQEGIYYFFEHDKGKHILVLADDIAAHQPFPEHDSIPFHAMTGGVRVEDIDRVTRLSVRQSVQSSKYSINDFDFEKPNIDLLARNEKSRDHAEQIPIMEIFDYPGEYKHQGDGDEYVARRLEELQSQFERVQVDGPCRVFVPGCRFTLTDHPRADQNREYLVISATYDAGNAGFYSGSGDLSYANSSAELMDSKEIFRSARVTPKPVVQGCQTAIVVGPDSEEIYCDEYGRVRVQFHWDRYGTDDQNSSCWIRVSQAWAGDNWGSMHIPRIGHEVIVSFLEGDPDQPIITGRVYNALNMPPYDLEGQKNVSGIKSRSTMDGTSSNFNELKMDDTSGSELLYIQAEKNESILVKNNKSENVGNDESVQIGRDREETVGRDETLTVARNQTRTTGKDHKTTITGKSELIIGQTYTENITGVTKLTHASNSSLTVGANYTVTITGTGSLSFGSSLSINAGTTAEFTAGASMNITAGGTMTIGVGASTITLTPATIVLTCGGSSISLNPGMISINGPVVNISGGMVNVNV